MDTGDSISSNKLCMLHRACAYIPPICTLDFRGVICAHRHPPSNMILDSVASNVESTLAFTLSVQIVDSINKLQRGTNGLKGPYEPVLMFCTGVVLFAAASAISSSADTSTARPKSAHVGSRHKPAAGSGGGGGGGLAVNASIIPSAVRKDMRDIASHVLVLAFSRMAMQQVREMIFFTTPKNLQLKTKCAMY